MGLLTSTGLWIGMAVFFGLLTIGLGIFYIILFKKTHVKTELKAVFSKTPIAIFFQDNKFCEWKPVTPVHGIIYDKYYGPFIMSNTYVDKKTKNIIVPLDVDLDGERDCNMKELVKRFHKITDNQKLISDLRGMVPDEQFNNTVNVSNMTSRINYGSLKSLFVSSMPHKIRSKIEKVVSQRVMQQGKVDPKQAIIVFGAIFGIIVIAGILIKTMGV